MIKPGIKWIELNDLAKEYIKSKGFDKYTNDKGEEIDYFNHSIGHSIGVEIHDPLPNGKDTILEENMVITVEPGIYDSNSEVGVRIEDDVLVTENGCIVLSKNIPKEMEEVIV